MISRPSAMFVSPPENGIALMAVCSEEMSEYWSSLNSSLPSVLKVTAPTRVLSWPMLNLEASLLNASRTVSQLFPMLPELSITNARSAYELHPEE